MIVEIGAGPGGGHMPIILEHDPSAKMMVNDFEIRMLTERKAFFEDASISSLHYQHHLAVYG